MSWLPALANATFALSLLLRIQKRPSWSVWALTATCLFLRLWAATLDPFLNDWDEAYHAVVAKNLITAPLTPMLFRETALPITTSWAEQHIWLHKPPFFLWQMALSVKIFGLHPWAVRIPGALWLTLLVPAVWRMGTLLRDELTGFVSAAVVTFAYVLQELTSGSLTTDQNDAIFIAVVGCGWWALLELIHSPGWRWAVLVGLLSAAAVLTKWYVGAFVFLPFGCWVLINRSNGQRWKWLLLALGTTAVPVLAWILHITSWFPTEAAFEWSFKAAHFSRPVDGHRGTATYHLDVIGDLFPPFTWWILLAALTWLVARSRTWSHRAFIGVLVVAVHGFFLMAQTRMPCYTLVLLPLYALAIGHALVSVVELLPREKWRMPILAAALVILCWSTLDPRRMLQRHSLEPNDTVDVRWRKQALAVMEQLPALRDFVSRSSKPILFNVPRNHHLRFMFAYGIEAWPKPPKPGDVERLRAAGYTVYAMPDGLPPESFPPGVVLVPDSVISVSHDVRS